VTFTSDVKSACVRHAEIDDCCRASELAAFIRLNGVLELGGAGKLGLSMRTENPATARYIYRSLKTLSRLPTHVYMRQKTKLRKNYTYLVSVRPTVDTKQFLIDLGMMDESYAIIPGVAKKFIERQCCRRAYLRGCFLASGTVSDPKSGSYHCEILTHDDIHKNDVRRLSHMEEIIWHQIVRKKDLILYLKDGEQITTFLATIGASTAALAYEDTRTYRGLRNHANRLKNSDAANLTKTVHTAVRQQEKIRTIAEMIGLDELPLDLREIAELRMGEDGTELSLADIGASLTNPLSKSAVNYRLRKIEALADKLESR